ncbi:S41 family peptidase [Anaerohalosphaera lusitana]|uniref:S41 family peptidase n=1 Tax=Anaerohalosphaera lusitana TaxID=1936003 RepID=UPI001474880F|nr:S41 family peptidase [Anaerohalosphaera lusitana]
MKSINQRLSIAILVTLAAVSGLVGCGYAASRSAEANQGQQIDQQLDIENGQKLPDLVAEQICEGDFAAARRVLAGREPGTNGDVEALINILSQYDTIEEHRAKSRKEAYQEQLDEIAKFREEGIPSEPNQISEAFVAVIKARDYAAEDKKDDIYEMPFVKKLVKRAKEAADELEAKGNWVDAYAHGYYWLTNLYKDNKDYEKHAEKLTEKAMIEVSLKDNSCETSEERHEGITAQMLEKSIRALEFNYVSVIDYGEMVEKALRRSRLLGEVVSKSAEEIAYEVTDEQAKAWISGIEAIEESISDPQSAVSRDKFLEIFEQVIAINEETLKLPPEVVIAQFSEASLEALDPFTTLVWPWRVLDFQKSMTQDFTGIGVQITKDRGEVKVGSLLPDTPAFNSGLDANDLILKINGESTEDMTLQCVVDKITGPAGTEVTLTVQHEGEEDGITEEITITRGRIVVPTIRGWQRTNEAKWRHMVDPANKIGYVRLTAFTENTATDLSDILDNLEEQGMKGLIIDLRFNSGGYLSTAADVVDLFVDRGLIVKSQPRWGPPSYEMAEEGDTHPDYPIVVLINGQSASASEIVAGALQDKEFRRATLVGERTYGKGSVQTITPFSGEGSQLKYTMAYYHLPSNQRVKNRYIIEKQGRKDWGIEPDVEVELRGDELKELLDVQLANDVLARSDHNERSELKRYSLEETLKADPQLAIGMIVVKSKVVDQGGDIKPSELLTYQDDEKVESEPTKTD